MRDGASAAAYTGPEEVAHAITHGLALILAIAGLTTLVVRASAHGDAWHVIGCTIFGSALVLLYAASTLYHGIPLPRAKAALRRLDHAAIFLLIAGTYTPFALVTLHGVWGWVLLAVVWSLAVLGIVLVTATDAAPRLVVLLYPALGWLAIIAFEPLVRSLHEEGLMLLVLGGVSYTVGMTFYAWRRLPYHHAIWHVFVMAGSACHFSCVLGYVVPPAP